MVMNEWMNLLEKCVRGVVCIRLCVGLCVLCALYCVDVCGCVCVCPKLY